jgi:hypothetical protein
VNRIFDKIKHVNTDDNWRAKYRLGDAYFCKNTAWNHLDRDRFEDTIGGDYVRQMGEQGKKSAPNLSLIKKIVNEHIIKYNYKLPEDNELVIHYRLGDRTYVKQKRTKYDTIEPDMNTTINKINRLYNQINANKITIVTAWHINLNREKHILTDEQLEDTSFLEKLIERLKDKNVDILSQEKPDADFCYLVKAKGLVTTCGYFSKLANLCNSNSISL